jgi:hypothetical protein
MVGSTAHVSATFRPTVLLVAALALGCGAPPARGARVAERSAAADDVRLVRGLPPLAVVVRDGDPRGGIAAIVATGGIAEERGAEVAVALGALVEARLEGKLEAQVLPGWDGYRVRALVASEEDAGRAAEAIRAAMLTPLAAKNYETIATALGPISRERLAPLSGDVVSGEVVLSGNLLASKGLAAPQGAYRLFGALRDGIPEALGGQPSGRGAPASQGPTISLGGPNGRGGPLNGPLGAAINSALGAAGQGAPILSPFSYLPPFYFGAYPTPAIFSWFGVGDVPLDAAGYGRSVASGLWQRRVGKFATASMQREILEVVTAQLRLIDAPRPAQAWLHAGDLARSKLASTINSLFYAGAKNAAVGNIRFLQSLSTQLRVPPRLFVAWVGGFNQLAT